MNSWLNCLKNGGKAYKKDSVGNSFSLILFLILLTENCIDGAYNDCFKDKKDAQWVDLERMIKEISLEKEKGIFDYRFADSYSGFLQQCYFSSEFEKPLITFKRLFTSYLKNQMNSGEIPQEGKFYFDHIICFNYISPYKGNKSLGKPTVHYIHGGLNDKEKCVFGYDDFMKMDEYSEGIGQIGKFELSKQYQLLELNKDQPAIRIRKIQKIAILGHSIGPQDYQYYFTLLDEHFSDIEIKVFWYKFDRNRRENYNDMKTSLFKMLKEYERRNNKDIINKMFFERRISFQEYKFGEDISY